MFESPFSPTTSASPLVQVHQCEKEYSSKEQIIAEAEQSIALQRWELGRLAAAFKLLGGGDSELADNLGVSRSFVFTRRVVWEKFGGDRSDYNHVLSWTHFREAYSWDDADECLEWAFEMNATVAEMKAWRRAQHGEDLTENPRTPSQQADGDNEPGIDEHDDEEDIEECIESHAPEELTPSGSDSARVPADGNGNGTTNEARRSGPEEPSNSGSESPAGTTEGETQSFDLNKSIMKIRKVCRAATAALADDEEKLDDFADELKSWERKMRPGKRFVPPTVEEVQGYCISRKSPVDPEHFVRHYEANNWRMKNGKKMKNWKQAVITWEEIRKRGRGGKIRDLHEQDVFDRYLNR